MTVVAGSSAAVRPLASDIDLFGLTHQGNVRRTNQDQFLIASLHKTMQVHTSSVPAEQLGDLKLSSRHVEGQESKFLEELERAVAESHAAVLEDPQSSATTLTMAVFRWPRAYLVHVGDSRCYRLRDGQLELLTKDQTMAQALVDAGVLPASRASETRWAHVLSSALGADQAKPVITATDSRWDDVMLLCTDGLTKHVTDAEIAEQLATVKSAEMICRNLIERTLARGASDNVTVVACRLHQRTT